MPDHRHERVDPGVAARGGQLQLLGGGDGLGVEVVDDLHVVGHEAHRHHHDRAGAPVAEPLEVVVDVGLEPGDADPLTASSTRLVRVPPPGLLPDPLDDLGGDAAVLRDVRAAVGPAALVHGQRDRVRDEHEVRPVAHGVRQLRQRGGASTTGSTKPGWLK